MRTAKDTDFFVSLEGVGKFRFGRRTFGDRIKIRAEFLALVRDLDSEAMDVDLAGMASIVAAVKVLCVSAPKGWEDIEEMDLLEDPAVEEKLYALYGSLRSKEDSFRRTVNTDAGGEEAGPRDGGDDGVLVPPEVRAVAA